ncbi:5-dehydro-4-deoxyglucarate dehydratase [Leucobacter tardus]|uniref:Probable 5-dehydro-4-deoxyglucarate dehydratase n=1 Tax=Leucobacter tardus TaxID=501483 RepID=A0A939QE00_9MICO|nr:5-dehydro-4-deoxyglucarate dehydratase [Leucobacter tardus]MBO2990091.1 5-dehydro-4-deoxyglucarate dehydratase [Leucobacter tardus]
MSTIEPQELASRIGSGLLSFPVTHFDDQLAFAEDPYREHIEWLSNYPVAGLFAAGGTGEYFSLTLDEVSRVVSAAVQQVNGRTSVLGPAGGSVAAAVAQARAVERAGGSGILLFPPYLTEAGQAGLGAYVEAVCSATSLGVIVYHRANAQYSADTLVRLAERCPNFIGFKDGVGSIEQMTQIATTLGDRLTYIGGLPTAETFALPYLELGVTTYSSAMFNFVPQFAIDFYGTVRQRDHATVFAALRDFVQPYLEVRNRVPGYAVSIVKAGLDAVGRQGGPVRPPLQNLSPEDHADLERIVERAVVPALV